MKPWSLVSRAPPGAQQPIHRFTRFLLCMSWVDNRAGRLLLLHTRLQPELRSMASGNAQDTSPGLMDDGKWLLAAYTDPCW